MHGPPLPLGYNHVQSRLLPVPPPPNISEQRLLALHQPREGLALALVQRRDHAGARVVARLRLVPRHVVRDVPDCRGLAVGGGGGYWDRVGRRVGGGRGLFEFVGPEGVGEVALVIRWDRTEGNGKGRGDEREVAVEGVALFLKLFGELELVVVLQDRVGDDDEGDVQTHGVQDRPGA